jgi:8-oxo-dGTP diphosphatase
MMKDRKQKSRAPILAAGGIVLRHDGGFAQLAVVHSRKLEWGLPKGKLASGEDAMTAARREVLEETGQHVTIHEFLGTLVYETNGGPKVIQFWRMEAVGEPAGRLMPDVKGVYWFPLEDAIGRLSHLRERVFLEQVGPLALKLAAQRADSTMQEGAAEPILVPGVPLAPAADAALADASAEVSQETEEAGKGLIEKTLAEMGLDGKVLVKRTWRWFRHAALLQRLPLN